jgi:hypothetical protein
MKYTVYISKVKKLNRKLMVTPKLFMKKKRTKLIKELMELQKHRESALQDWMAQNG